MRQRISATLIIALLYLFLTVPGIPPVDSMYKTLSTEGADSANSQLFGDIIISKASPLPNAVVDDTLVTADSLVAQYNEHDRSWSLPAKVVQLKDVSIYGRPGTIAQVEYIKAGTPNHAWAVIEIDDHDFSENSIALAVGQEIILEVSGEYVSSKGVDWDACPRTDKYCEYANFIEGGFPTSEDYNGLTICPSNAFIYSGYASEDWINGMLAWKIKVLN